MRQVRREHASVLGLSPQAGRSWNTAWGRACPLLEVMAGDESRFAGVERVGVDEHLCHHVSPCPLAEGGREPKELTRMVELTPGPDGKPQARLLGLVPRRCGKAYGAWLDARGPEFQAGVRRPPWTSPTATTTPSATNLDDAVAVLDAFHVAKLGTQAVVLL